MNTKLRQIFWIVLFVCPATLASAGTISIPLVTVGDPGNVADPDTGYGSVKYAYHIGEYDVTIGDCTGFSMRWPRRTPTACTTRAWPSPRWQLSIPWASRRSGSSGSYTYSVAGSYSQAANCPIYDVSWGMPCRFVNWLANGQPAGAEKANTTETGTYSLNGGTSNVALMQVSRNPGSTWVLPTVNEWYKAAYYVGGGTNAGYWTYPTQSNTPPSNVLSASGYQQREFRQPLTTGHRITALPTRRTSSRRWAHLLASPAPMVPTTRAATYGSGTKPPTAAAGKPEAAVLLTLASLW